MHAYAKKTPKSEKPDSTLYTYHEIISHRNCIRIWNQGYYRVVSIDPGEKNLAIRIEKRSYDARNITTEIFDKHNLYDYSLINPDNDKECKTPIYDMCNKIFDQYMRYFITSHIIIIERQLPQNYRAVRISQSLITYFLITLKNSSLYPMIYEINNKLKTKQLDAPPNLTDKMTKKWAIELCMLILKKRGDDVSLQIIEKAPKRKQDDLSDTVVQIEALFRYFGYPTTFDTMDVISESYFSVSLSNQINHIENIVQSNNNQQYPLLDLSSLTI